MRAIFQNRVGFAFCLVRTEIVFSLIALPKCPTVGHDYSSKICGRAFLLVEMNAACLPSTPFRGLFFLVRPLPRMKANQAAFEAGQLAERMAQGYNAHAAA